jgi:hypothetical protein
MSSRSGIMLKILTTIAFATAFAGAALAQTGSGSAGGSPGGGGTGASSPVTRLPGTMPGRSDTAPGSAGPSSGGAILPPGQSPAQQTRQGRGTSDLNKNSATTGPTGIGPTGVGPTGVGPTGVGPTGVGPGGTVRPDSAGSGAATQRPRPLGPGTGARDTGVPDSSVYNPGVPSRQR